MCRYFLFLPFVGSYFWFLRLIIPVECDATGQSAMICLISGVDQGCDGPGPGRAGKEEEKYGLKQVVDIMFL